MRGDTPGEGGAEGLQSGRDEGLGLGQVQVRKFRFSELKNPIFNITGSVAVCCV